MPGQVVVKLGKKNKSSVSTQSERPENDNPNGEQPTKNHHHSKEKKKGHSGKHKHSKENTGNKNERGDPEFADPGNGQGGANSGSGSDHAIMEGSSEEFHPASLGSGADLPPILISPLDITDSNPKEVASAHSSHSGFATLLKEWKPDFPRNYGYYSLFRYATGVDVLIMIVGIIAAILAGFCIPGMIYFLGKVIRAVVLAEKIANAHACKEKGRQECQIFWDSCVQSSSNPHNYVDSAFLVNETSPPPDVQKIAFNYMREFVEWQLFFTLAYTILSSVYFFSWSYASQNQGSKIRRAFFMALLHKDMTWFDLQKDPESINRMMENTRRITEGIGECVPIAIELVVMSAACCALAFAHGWRLSLVSLITVPLLVVTTWMISSAAADRLLKERRAYRIAHEITKDVLSKMRTVIVYAAQMREKALYKRELSRRDSSVIIAICLQAGAVFIMYVVNFGVWAVALWYGTALVLFSHENCSDAPKQFEYDPGDMVIIIMAIIFGCANVYLVAFVLKALQVALLCGEEAFKVIDSPHGIDNMSTHGSSPQYTPVGRIELVDVRFTYPGNSKRGLVLNHLNLIVEPRRTTAVVGLSESGKSSILKLICKEYLPDSGVIKIDDMDIRTLNTQWLRSLIGYVPQDVTLFDTTIEENVRMGKLDASFYEIQDACKKAGAHDFILSFKDGYRARIGHKGNLLTPGQQQQIAIARALIRDPKILLMDEPTYSLDSQSTAEFMHNLKKISKGRTVLFVAHRLNTIVHSNMIYVVKKGKVIEKGDHLRLIKSNGPYAQLSSMDRPSQSIREESYIEGFDTSEMSIISTTKTFNAKPILPNLLNNTLSVDPVVSKVSYAILKNDQNTARGYNAKLEWLLGYGEPLPQISPHEDNIYGSRMPRPMLSQEDQAPVQNMFPSAITFQTIREPGGGEGEVIVRKTMPDNLNEYDGLVCCGDTTESSWLQVLKMGSSNSIGLIIVGVLATILLAIGIPLFGFFFTRIINIHTDPTLHPEDWIMSKRLADQNYSSWFVASIACLGLYTGIFGFLQELCLNLAAFRTVQKLRRLLYGSMLRQDMSFFDEPENNSTKLASILFQDTDGIRHVTIGMYATFLQSVVVGIAAVGLCMYHAIELTGYTLLIVGVIVGVNMFDGWLAKKQHGRMISSLERMSRLILEVFQNKSIITACQMEPYFIQSFIRLQTKSLTVRQRIACVRIVTYGISQSAIFWGLAATFGIGADKIKVGDETFLNVITISFVLVFGLATLGTNLSVIMGFHHVGKGCNRMLNIINRQPLISSTEGVAITQEECWQKIEFVHTHFWKPHTTDVALMKGVNLVISPNKVTAIVGSHESGKSAYLEILGRYYDATGGMVLIDGKDIRNFSADSLRDYISVVSKDPELLNRTVAQNIAVGDNSQLITMDKIISAAKEANVHSFIVSLPEGYETRIGGDHDYLSGGQKFKIAIARALLKRPKILIIDDITSLLDKEGEKAVLDSIEQAKQGRTVIFISHRIHPVHKAFRIAVMENGFMEEIGTHKELLKTRPDGIYSLMWRSQNPLEDENFIKGKVSFGPPREVTGGPSKKEAPKTEEPKPVPFVPPDQHAPEAEKEEESKGLCGSLFGYMGLGIVENEEDYFENRPKDVQKK